MFFQAPLPYCFNELDGIMASLSTANCFSLIFWPPSTLFRSGVVMRNAGATTSLKRLSSYQSCVKSWCLFMAMTSGARKERLGRGGAADTGKTPRPGWASYAITLLFNLFRVFSYARHPPMQLTDSRAAQIHGPAGGVNTQFFFRLLNSSPFTIFPSLPLSNYSSP